ncbi:unnamed protein product [Toxocara canis]|uniref:DNA-directed RNA polymerase n=1 Tax=Toxocara canis TaxID=6265 RepID=A0A183UD72_TOXCA|nr:unnamed protein product [Toxocara canis]
MEKVVGLYPETGAPQLMTRTVETQLLWLGYRDIQEAAVVSEAEGVPWQPMLLTQRSKLDMATVLLTLKKQEYGDCYKCGPILYIST